MKKINFEKLSDKDLFGKFEQNKLISFQSASLRGGTRTSLCLTTEGANDTDLQGEQEDANDSRCNGYT